MSDKYFNQNMTRVGQGVLTTGAVTAGSGLDLIYREAHADLGACGGQIEKDWAALASILDEVGKGDGGAVTTASSSASSNDLQWI